MVFVLDVFLFVCFECSPTSDLLKCSFFITSPSHHHKASRITQVANVQAEHKHLPLRAWECHRRQRSLEQKSLFSQHVYRFGRIVVRCIEASSTGDSAICVVLSLQIMRRQLFLEIFAVGLVVHCGSDVILTSNGVEMRWNSATLVFYGPQAATVNATAVFFCKAARYVASRSIQQRIAPKALT